MDNFIPAQLIIISEIGVLLALISAVAIFMLFNTRKKERLITGKLVSEFKQNSPERKKHLLQLLKEKYQMDSGEAEKYMEDIYNQEKTLYAKILKIFYRHERSEISHIRENIQALTEAYENLGNSKQPVLQDAVQEHNDQKISEEMERMLNENERLKADLKQALESVDRIQSEYIAIYDKYENKE